MHYPAALLALCSASAAQAADLGPRMSAGLTPPSAYQGDAVVSVSFVDPERVPALCEAMGARLASGTYALACQTGGTIYLPNPCRWPNHSDYQRLACHELAHANGWPANHPAH